VYYWAEYQLARRGGGEDFRAVALPEVGKIRVATIHSAKFAHMGRALSTECVGMLARLPWFREGLTGTTTPLQGEGSLYSADLTAATEYISFDRATAIIEGIGEALDWPVDKRKAAKKLVGKQLLHTATGTKWTTQGVLLGLGISWTCLSVLNAFNAWVGDWKDESFKVCGDDLLGLWSDARRQRYKTNTTSSGLKLNDSKSFLSPHTGIFCERLELSNGKTTRAVHKIGMRQAAAGKYRARPGKTGLVAVREGLTKALRTERGPLRRLIGVTLQRTKVRGMPCGPGWLGGDGGPVQSSEDARDVRAMLVAWLYRGDCSTMRGTTESQWAAALRDLRDEVLPGVDARVRLSHVEDAVRLAFAQREALQTSSKATEKTKQELRRQGRGRTVRGRALLQTKKKSEFYLNFRDCERLSIVGRRRIRALVQPLLNLIPSPALVNRVVSIISRHRRDPLVDPISAEIALQGMNLAKQPLQNGGFRPWGFIRRFLTKPRVRRVREVI
jgi:hypothetical protein